MQTVSQAWKDAQRQTIVPLSFLEIAIGVGDPEAQAGAVCSDNGHEAFSQVQGVTDEARKSPVKYATLEPGLWPLDGTRRLVDGDAPPPGQAGVIGAGRIGQARINRRGI